MSTVRPTTVAPGWLADLVRELPGTTSAGSLLPFATDDHVDVARALVAAGAWVHADVVLRDEGVIDGVPLTSLLAVREEVPGAPVEVHLIDLRADRSACPAEVLEDLAPCEPDRVVLPPERLLPAEEPAVRRLRETGAEIWAEVTQQDPERARALARHVDGLLVMLIEPGTRGVADLRHLPLVRDLVAVSRVGVDGGVDREVAAACLGAGATHLVSGRALVAAPAHPGRPEPAMSTTAPPRRTELPTSMRASVLTGLRRVEVQERPVPRPLPGEVLVRVASVGVCGSDVHYYREGRIGDFVVDGPLVLGHEVSGRVVATGEGVPASRVGERVALEPQRPCRTCPQCTTGRYNLCPHMRFLATPPVDGAFAEYVTCPALFAHAVPAGLSDDAAALLEPLSVGIASMRRASVRPGSRVLVAGAGPIGVIAAQTARAFGAREVVVSDPVAERRERALSLGATSVVDPVAAPGALLDLGADAFVDASGVGAAVVAGITALRPGGTAVLVGLGSSSYALPVSAIQDRELWVTGVFRYTDTWPLAAHLVDSGQVALDPLVTGRFDLDHVADALEQDVSPQSLKSVVVPTRTRTQQTPPERNS